jgi:hypothetical protein
MTTPTPAPADALAAVRGRVADLRAQRERLAQQQAQERGRLGIAVRDGHDTRVLRSRVRDLGDELDAIDAALALLDAEIPALEQQQASALYATAEKDRTAAEADGLALIDRLAAVVRASIATWLPLVAQLDAAHRRYDAAVQARDRAAKAAGIVLPVRSSLRTPLSERFNGHGRLGEVVEVGRSYITGEGRRDLVEPMPPAPRSSEAPPVPLAFR